MMISGFNISCSNTLHILGWEYDTMLSNTIQYLSFSTFLPEVHINFSSDFGVGIEKWAVAKCTTMLVILRYTSGQLHLIKYNGKTQVMGGKWCIMYTYRSVNLPLINVYIALPVLELFIYITICICLDVTSLFNFCHITAFL